MSKSNKEKSRILSIKKYMNGDLPFSSELLKIKIIFVYSTYIYKKKSKKTKTMHFRKSLSQSIEKDILKKYKDFFINLLIPISKNHNLFEFTVNLNINFSLSYDKVFAQINILHKDYNLCELNILNIPPIEIIYKNFNLNFFLNHYFSILNQSKENICFIKSVFTPAFKDRKSYHKNKIYDYTLQPIFKTTQFYKNIDHLISYLNKNKSVLKIGSFGADYDLIKNNFNKIIVNNNQYVFSKPPNKFSISNQNVFENDLDILKCLKTMGFFQFDIDGLSETDILDMCELINY